MSKLDETISQVAYILDNLILLRQILSTGDCNNCKHKGCVFTPKPGEMVRYNCPSYEPKDKQE